MSHSVPICAEKQPNVTPHRARLSFFLIIIFSFVEYRHGDGVSLYTLDFDGIIGLMTCRDDSLISISAHELRLFYLKRQTVVFLLEVMLVFPYFMLCPYVLRLIIASFWRKRNIFMSILLDLSI